MALPKCGMQIIPLYHRSRSIALSDELRYIHTTSPEPFNIAMKIEISSVPAWATHGVLKFLFRSDIDLY